MLDKAVGFIFKHRFPKHIFGIHDFVVGRLARAYYTLYAKAIFRMQGCEIGDGAVFDGPVIVRCDQWNCIQIGKNIKVNSRKLSNLVGLTGPAIFQCLGPGSIQIGDNCGLSATVLSARMHIAIGNNVTIGANVRILDHDFHSLNHMDRRDVLADNANCSKMAVTVGDDTLIGTNAVILKGVQIGERVIVGANSVVALKSVPPDCVVAGNPARIIARNARKGTSRSA